MPRFFPGKAVPGIEKGWELIKSGSFTGSFDITGLDGDSDKIYKLIIRSRHAEARTIKGRFNGSDLAYYNENYHWSRNDGGFDDHGSVNYTANTEFSLAPYGHLNHLIEATIMAKSGGPRLVLCNNIFYDDSTNFGVSNTMTGWIDIYVNIETINVIVTDAVDGDYFLFRIKE